jgi:hypothetical protein
MRYITYFRINTELTEQGMKDLNNAIEEYFYQKKITLSEIETEVR